MIFRPSSRLKVPQWVARLMNSLNMLGPALMLLAIAAGFTARFGEFSPAETRLLLSFSGALVVAALVIRIGWGIAVRMLYRRYATQPDQER